MEPQNTLKRQSLLEEKRIKQELLQEGGMDPVVGGAGTRRREENVGKGCKRVNIV
jgi:hypothetical protein